MTKKIAPPDLMVYLHADVPTLLNRIQKRGRESEKSIPADYLQLLNNLYKKFIEEHVDCPVLVIDANKEDNLNGYLEKTIHKIADKINSLDLRVTTPGLREWVTLPQTKATLSAIDAEQNLEKYLKNNPKLITVAGNVGLGKSTLTAIMERSLGLTALYENPLENPLLEKFLGDKATHCYDLQLHFLQMRSEHRKIGKSGDQSYIKDRSLPEDLLVFCHQFNKDGYLTDDQLDRLTTEFKTTSNSLPPSDLMVILQGKPELAWQRIKQRGREMEVKGGWSYNDIRSLGKFYTTYANDVQKFGFHNGPVLEINIEKLDLTNRIHMGYIFEQIYNKFESS
jgi:deoxyadenosine/deoxycytidine kinase